jgi:hypothetical protein
MGKVYEPVAPSEYSVTPVVAISDSLHPQEVDADSSDTESDTVTTRLDAMVWSNTVVNTASVSAQRTSRLVDRAIVASSTPAMALAPPPTSSDLVLAPSQQDAKSNDTNNLPKTPIVTCSDSPYGGHSGTLLSNRAKRRREIAVSRPGWEVDASGRGTNKTLRICGCCVGFVEDKSLKDIVSAVVIEVRVRL